MGQEAVGEQTVDASDGKGVRQGGSPGKGFPDELAVAPDIVPGIDSLSIAVGHVCNAEIKILVALAAGIKQCVVASPVDARVCDRQETVAGFPVPQGHDHAVAGDGIELHAGFDGEACRGRDLPAGCRQGSGRFVPGIDKKSGKSRRRIAICLPLIRRRNCEISQMVESRSHPVAKGGCRLAFQTQGSLPDAESSRKVAGDDEFSLFIGMCSCVVVVDAG